MLWLLSGAHLYPAPRFEHGSEALVELETSLQQAMWLPLAHQEGARQPEHVPFLEVFGASVGVRYNSGGGNTIKHPMALMVATNTEMLPVM